MSVSPLSGFTAVPNPQMLAFMGAQSFIMMYQAGEGWQYGKRRISAMSNEEFNKLTPEIVLEKQAVVLQNSLGTIKRSMDSMTPLISTIVEQYGDFIHEMIKSLPELVKNIFGGPSTGTVPTVPGDYATRPGTPGFITPITPYIPKFIPDKPPRPTIPFPPPKIAVPFGPQPGTQPPKTIQPDTRIKPTPSPLGKRQVGLEESKRRIDNKINDINKNITTSRMWMNKRKKIGPHITASTNGAMKAKQTAAMNSANQKTRELYLLQLAHKNKYGVWYSSSIAVLG